jgi:hypothetical protein
MPILGSNSSSGSRPSTPTIGSATDGGTGTTASVAFTPSTYIGKGTITYTATSSPGSITATSSSSPITVSGLTTGTAYTFTVQGTTNYGIASAASSASNSVTPANPSSYESIASTTLTSTTASITFSSIPATYKHLQVRLIGKSGYTGGTGPDNFDIRFNSDNTQTNYNRHFMRGNGTDAATLYSNDNVIVACISTSLDNADTYGAVVLDILDYANTSKNKTTRVLGGVDYNSTLGHMVFGSVLWRNTAAINTLYVAPGNQWATNTRVALYGIKG